MIRYFVTSLDVYKPTPVKCGKFPRMEAKLRLPVKIFVIDLAQFRPTLTNGFASS